jgi:hypothetical protein
MAMPNGRQNFCGTILSDSPLKLKVKITRLSGLLPPESADRSVKQSDQQKTDRPRDQIEIGNPAIEDKTGQTQGQDEGEPTTNEVRDRPVSKRAGIRLFGYAFGEMRNSVSAKNAD